jgi:hypothetical protein
MTIKEKRNAVKLKNNMKNKIMVIEESLYEFSKRGRPKKGKSPERMRGIDSPDMWNDLQDEEETPIEDINVDTSDMETADEIEVDDNGYGDELQAALNNEVQMLEINRRELTFRIKGDLDKVYNGIPLAKMGNGEAFLFKLDDGKIKKIFINDIIVEQQKGKNNRAITINE